MWKTVKLGDVIEIARGGSPRPIKDFITNEDDGINWIKIGDTKQGDRYIHTTKQKIKPSGVSRSRYVKENDFLLSNSMSFGRPYILKTSGCIHDGWLVLSGYQELFSADYLYYLLSSSLVQNQFESLARGSTVRNLNIELVSQVTVLVPPLEEQQRIVAKLDAAFAEIESLNKIASIRKAELAKLKEALLLKTLSSEKSDLINLGDVCELIYGKGLDKIYRLENDGIPAYGANGIKAYSTKILSDEPSIIIGRKGSAGELTRVSSAFWALDVTYYTKINKKLIDLDFLYYTLSSMDLPSMAKGVKPGINRNDVYKRLIYLPTLEEQKHIVSILDATYIEIEKVNDSVSKLKNNCGALKTAILKEELQSSEAA